MNTSLQALSDAGVSIWLDDLSRQRLATGNLAALIADYNVTGVTTNPTIFAAALASRDHYTPQLSGLAAAGVDADQAIRTLTTDDVRAACDVLAEVYTATGGRDGRVSIEVDPRLAFDTDATVANALDLWKTVERPNVMIKIPATEAGLPAITAVLAQGISVNVTLIFGLPRYRAVIEAYLSGLEQAAANGHDLATIHSVASFFISRVDTEFDARLTAVGTDEALALRGHAAIANARLAYGTFTDVFGSDRFAAPRRVGRQPPTSPVGLDRRQGPQLPRHALRHRPRRRRHRQHHAGEDTARLRRPRHLPRRPGQRKHRRRPAGDRRPRPRGHLLRRGHRHPRTRGRGQVHRLLGRTRRHRRTRPARCPLTGRLSPSPTP